MTDKPNRQPGKPGSHPKTAHSRPSDRLFSPRADRGPRTERQGRAPSGPEGAAHALIELDRDIMKLLVRRAKLVSRIRQGRDHAASPAAVIAEKNVRKAWESGATAFSRDPRFARQLFSLLQELQVLSREESQKESFGLTPSTKPVKVAITGSGSALTAKMWLAMAASLGIAAEVGPVTYSSELKSCMNACNQAGASITIDAAPSGIGKAYCEADKKASCIGKTVFFGDDIFSLYFFSLTMAGTTGTARLTGGKTTKSADLSPLKNILSLLGARFVQQIPHSSGLPAVIESSGEIPKGITIPEDTPFEGVCAFLLAPLCWSDSVFLKLDELPAGVATAALSAVDDIFRKCGSCVEMHGSLIMYNHDLPNFSGTVSIPVDPVLAAYQLAVPAFCGGSVTLKGRWPVSDPISHTVESLLKLGGLDLSVTDECVIATKSEGNTHYPSAGECAPYASLDMAILQTMDIPPSLLPLILALAASADKTGDLCLPSDVLKEGDEVMPVAESMLASLGYMYDAGNFKKVEQKLDKTPWFAPDAFWGMGYALCSFLVPGLLLVNPITVSEVQPVFWPFFNGLPEPADPAMKNVTKEEGDKAEKTGRRRIIAG